MELYSNQMQSYTFNIEIVKSHHKSEDGSYKKRKFNNSILTFDIEVTSAWIKNGKVIQYEKGKSDEYWNNLEAISLCYLWQFSCDGKVYYGRELRDFLNVLNDLPKVETIIWVHNLPYEFVFLTNILSWHSVFARTPHKPIKAVSLEFPHIEFRCTYSLTRLKLETWGEQLGLNKLVGQLDYEQLRTPLTSLTQEELDYGERDCLVVEKGIQDYLKRYKKQRNIPLTQTGTVRREVKELLTSDKEYVHMIKKLIPHNADEYQLLQDIFAGGYTHANRFYAGFPVIDNIQHFDFSSSYPTVMIAEKYPMSPWIYTGLERMVDESTFEDYAYIFELEFSQLNATTFNTYIQASKCKYKNPKLDNGRVIKADYLKIKVTEQDYLTIKESYEWKEMKVLNVWKSRKAYLPKPFTEYILQLYRNKTELKDVEGKEDLYMQSKQYINSMFGMCVTAIVQANVILENDVWHMQALNKNYINDRLEKLRSYNPREKRYFLNYSWGCWVTAYARRNLWKCILSCDKEVLYADTDSIFVLGTHDFSWYDTEITNKIKKACDIMGLDFSATRPKTKKGKEKPLGIFTQEDDCIEFITLGAKRYCERRKNDNKLHLTISGINKGAVELLNDDIENFKDGFEFNKDADCVTKRLCTYLSEMPVIEYPDGYLSTYTHGINLRRTGYTLGITDEYSDLIKLEHFNISNFSENFIIKMRGEFS